MMIFAIQQNFNLLRAQIQQEHSPATITRIEKIGDDDMVVFIDRQMNRSPFLQNDRLDRSMIESPNEDFPVSRYFTYQIYKIFFPVGHDKIAVLQRQRMPRLVDLL